MGKRYEQYTPEFKQRVVKEYRAGESGSGAKALAGRHSIRGGHRTVMQWVRRYNGKRSSLAKRTKPNRERILTHYEAARFIRNPMLIAHKKRQLVVASALHPKVVKGTGKQISVRSVRRYAHDYLKWRQKPVQLKTLFERISSP
jgi:transposase-like protein